MHACLNVDEIIRFIASQLVASGAKETAVSLASYCKSFEDPVLDTLWEAQNPLLPLLESLPGGVWNEGGCVSFRRFPTPPERARFRKYARRMRKLIEHDALDFLSPQVFEVLRLCAINEPLFPNLRAVQLGSASGSCIPFIPLFLSPRTAAIRITFANPRKEAVAWMIATFPKLCPNLQDIGLHALPRDPMITAAVSEIMLLATNRNALRSIYVDSPLTEEAHEMIYGLTGLREVSVSIEGGIPVPPVVFPDLVRLVIKYDHDDDGLRMFRGATFGKLGAVTFYPDSEQIGDFLEAFEKVGLAASIQNTLSELHIFALCPWNPKYPSLLPFTQLTNLVIEFACEDVCASSVDDDIITSLARAMPKMEAIYLGGPPCPEIPIGVTVKGLAILAHHCPYLITLRIHFQLASLFTPPAISGTVSNVEHTTPGRECVLAELDVGEIPMPGESVLMVALTLARIFPNIDHIDYADENWRTVVDAIHLSGRIVDYSRATLENGG